MVYQHMAFWRWEKPPVIHSWRKMRKTHGTAHPQPPPPHLICSEDKIQLRFISEKTMAAHSSTPAWKIPWTEEPDGLQSMGSLRVGHDQVTSLSPFTFMHWRRKWQPTPVFLPGESQGRGSLVGSMGPHRVGHDWSDLAAAVACFICFLEYVFFFFSQYLG